MNVQFHLSALVLGMLLGALCCAAGLSLPMAAVVCSVAGVLYGFAFRK